jgi:hypothetical protein
MPVENTLHDDFCCVDGTKMKVNDFEAIDELFKYYTETTYGTCKLPTCCRPPPPHELG